QPERMFQNILPYHDLEGDAAAVLGHVAEFIERVVATVQALQLPRRLDEWTTLLSRLLEVFFHPSEPFARELQTVRDVLADLRRQQSLSGFNQTLSLPALLEQLRPALEADIYQTGFLTGGVTFCSLKPMRSIPFRVLCLVGMNDSVFPRSVPHVGF